MIAPIKKAVFPVAGLGTRFLPATKANPKEMLPIVDKPLIQYAVEEAVAAGVVELIFVTSSTKRSIEDHFDSNYELESKLEERAKYKLLATVRNILPQGVSCIYLRQPQPLGLGHAVLCAKPVVGDEPFAVLLADDLIDCGVDFCLASMAENYQQHGNSMVAVEEIPREDSDKYGIVTTDMELRISNIVEKPKPSETISNLAVVGRYILNARIFELLECVSVDAGGEIQLTDAIAKLLEQETVYAYRFAGRRYDCGSKLGYLEATFAYALKHPEVGAEFQAFLQKQKTSTLLT